MKALAPGWREWFLSCLSAPCTESYEAYTGAASLLEVAVNAVEDKEDARTLIPTMNRHPHDLVRKRAVLLAARFGLREFAVDFANSLLLSVEHTEFSLLCDVLEGDFASAGFKRVERRPWSVIEDSRAGVMGEPLASTMAALGVRDVVAMAQEVSRSSLGLLELCGTGSAAPSRFELLDATVGVCEVYLGLLPYDVSVALLLALNRDYSRLAVPFGPIRALGEVEMFSDEDWSSLWKGDLVTPIVALSDPRLLPILHADDARSRLTKSARWPDWAPVIDLPKAGFSGPLLGPVLSCTILDAVRWKPIGSPART